MKTLKQNWKTTLSGIMVLALTGLAAYRNPAILADPSTIAQIGTGVGLIIAKDGSK